MPFSCPFPPFRSFCSICSFLASPRGGLWLAVVVWLADQVSKGALRMWVLPSPETQVTVLPVFNLVHAWNYGVSFSLFAHSGPARKWVLVGVMLLISALVVFWLWHATRRLPLLAYGLILGGALGNITDRLIHGAVFDFLQFHLAGYYWPSFNLADSAIVVGVGLLLLDSLLHREKANGSGT